MIEMAFRNQVLKIPYHVQIPHPNRPGFGMDIENPEVEKLKDGTYRPPDGWRALALSTYDHGYLLLLEQEILEHPYR